MGTICSPLIFSCSYFFSLSFFQKDFQSEVEVKNLDTKESYMIHERVVRDSVWLRMTSKDDKTRTCSYSKLSGFGHTIYFKKLTFKVLPNKCAAFDKHDIKYSKLSGFGHTIYNKRLTKLT